MPLHHLGSSSQLVAPCPGFRTAGLRMLRDAFSLAQHVIDRGGQFVTLSYGLVWPGSSQAKKQLKAFFNRLERKYGFPAIIGGD